MKTNGNDSGASRFGNPMMLGSGVVLAIAVAVVWWPGCRQYPPATSLESYTIMEALYTACNTKNADSLAKVEQWIDRSFGEGKLSQAEKDAFSRIIGMAKDGAWKDATKAAYRFSQDQVGQGQVFPKSENQHAMHDNRSKH